MAISNDSAALLGLPCEAMLLGAYFCLFLATHSLLLCRPRTISRPIVIANCALFFSCAAHFALELEHAVLTLGTTGVNGFADETPTLLGADILISLSDFIGGLILLYRCWVIWGKNNLIVLLPLCTAIVGFGCILALAHLVMVTDPSAPSAPAAVVPLGLAGYVLPLFTNAVATTLIVYRLLTTTRHAIRAKSASVDAEDAERCTARAVRRAIAIIVESGLLYLATQLTFVILFALGHPAQAVVAVIAAQIYGIAPTLMVMQVALGFSDSSTDHHGRARAGSGSSSGGSRRASTTQVASGFTATQGTHGSVYDCSGDAVGSSVDLGAKPGFRPGAPRTAFMSGVSGISGISAASTLVPPVAEGGGGVRQLSVVADETDEEDEYFGVKLLDLEKFGSGELGMAL